MNRTEEFQAATEAMLDKAFAPKVEIKVAPLTRLQEHEANVARIKAIWGPARALDELEASVTVVVAQKYEAIIQERVDAAVKARIQILEANARAAEAEKVRERLRHAKRELEMHLDDANDHLIANNFGMAQESVAAAVRILER